ncbi:MAG: ferredoxin [Myxococcota bacterium]
MYRVVIDPALCIGSSNCMEEAPDAYEVNERGVAELIAPTAPPEEVLRGARACPVDAIHVFDATGRRLHP